MGGRVEVTRRLGLLKRESQQTPEVELVAGRQTGWTEDLYLRALCVPVPIRIEVFNLVDKAFVQRDRGIERAEGMLDERELSSARARPGSAFPGNPFG